MIQAISQIPNIDPITPIQVNSLLMILQRSSNQQQISAHYRLKKGGKGISKGIAATKGFVSSGQPTQSSTDPGIYLTRCTRRVEVVASPHRQPWRMILIPAGLQQLPCCRLLLRLLRGHRSPQGPQPRWVAGP